MNTATIVATFNDYSTARQAARELEDIGIPANSIYIESNQKTAGAGSTDYQTGQSEGGFMGWWHSIFGTDQHTDQRQGYERVLSGGNAILRATVPSESVDAAVDLLNQRGAVNI